MANDEDNKDVITSVDDLDLSIAPSVHKLDADQYAADDIDGVTESLFGSGNMAYASLQASQTDAILSTTSGNVASEIADVANNSGVSGGRTGQVQNYADDQLGDTRSNNSTSNDDIITDTDRSVDAQDQFSLPNGSGGSDANFASSTVGSISASQLSSDAGVFAPNGSGLSLQEGLDGANGADGETPDIPDLPTPNDGVDGKDGVIGDTNIEVNLGDVNIDLGDLTEIIDLSFVDLGDVISVLINPVNNLTEVLGDIINNLDASQLINLTEIITIVDELTINLSETISNTLIEITNITDDVTNLIESVLDFNDLQIDLDLDLLGSDTLDVNIPVFNIQDTNIDLDVNLDPAVNLANDIAELTSLDVLSDGLAELGGTIAALQGAIDQVTVLVSDINLADPVATVDQLLETLGNLDNTISDVGAAVDDSISGVLENLGIGDGVDEGEILQEVEPVIDAVTDVVDDLTGGATEDVGALVEDTVDAVADVADGVLGGLADGLLGGGDQNDDGADSDVEVGLGLGAQDDPIIDEAVEAVLDPVEDLVGDVDLDLSAGVLGDGETDNNAGDTDITVETNIDIVDEALADVGLDVPLDPVEGLVGDIDVDLDLATNLLGDQADPLVNDGAGGTGEDTILSDVGDAVADVADGVLGGLADGLLGGGDQNDDGADSDVEVGLGLGAQDDPIIDEAVEAVLDPVEDLVGDVDLDLSAGVLGDGETDNNAGDTDVTVETNIDIVDEALADVGLDVPLDPVEGLVGDIDVDLDLATNLLGDQADPLVNDGAGGTGEDTILSDVGDAVADVADGVLGGLADGLDAAINLLDGNNEESGESDVFGDNQSWTESTITDGGGLFGDIINGTDGLGDALPDPMGTVAEGIGVLDVDPELDLGGIGGLFG